MPDPYQMLLNTLSNYGEQTGWNEKNRLAPIDWKTTFAKMFHGGGKQDNALDSSAVISESGAYNTPSALNVMTTPRINANLDSNASIPLSIDTSIKTPDYMQQYDLKQPETLTNTGESAVYSPPQSQYSPDNPYTKVKPSGNTFFAYKESPELLTLKDQWEENKKKNALAEQYSSSQYVTVDQNMLNQIPEQYRGYFQPGQKIKRDELMKLIPTTTKPQTMTPYQTEQLKIDWYNATKAKDETLKDPLLMNYKDLDTAIKNVDTGADSKKRYSSQYSSAIRTNISDPKKAQEYINRYNYINGTGFTYNDWAVQAQKQYNPTTNKPVNVASKQNQNNKKPVTTVQLRDKKTKQIITAYVGIKNGQHYSTEAEAKMN